MYSSVEVEYFGDYVPNEEEIEDFQMYSNNVREFYSKKMGIPKVDWTLADKKYFNLEKDFDKCSQSFREEYGVDCTSKNYCIYK